MKLDSTGKYDIDDGSRRKVGDRLCRLIEAGASERDNLKTRWEENFKNYVGANEFTVPFMEGTTCPSFNIVGPRINALTDNVVGQITTMNPMLMAEMRGSSDRLEDVEDCLDFFLELANAEMKLRQVSTLCGIYDLVHVRVTYDHVVEGMHALATGENATTGDTRTAYTGLHLEVIGPNDFVVVRSLNCDLASSPLYGHRFTRLRRDVKTLQAIGRYYETTQELPAQDNIKKISDQNEFKVRPADTGYEEDDPIDLYDVVFRAKPSEIGLGEENSKEVDTCYHAIVNYQDRVLLSLKPFMLKRPNYAAFRMKVPIPGSYWPNGSVCQDLQALQSFYNHLSALEIFGGYGAAFPAVATNGNPSQSKALSPNQLVFMDGTEIQVVTNGFKGEWIAPAKADVLRLADAQIGISQAGVGQEFSADPTATEVQNVAAGQATRLQGFAAQFSSGLEELAGICCEVLSVEAQFWATGIYGDQIEVTPQLLDDLSKPLRWTVTGKKPDATPRSMIEKYKLLLSMAQGGADGASIVDAAVAFMTEMGLQPDAIQHFQESAAGLGGPFDIPELYKSIVNALELPNGKKIFKQDGQPGQNPPANGPVPNGGMGVAQAIFGQPSQLPDQQFAFGGPR